MTYFNEGNTVEQFVLDTLSDRDNQWRVAEPKADYLDSHLTLQISSLKWRFVSAEELPRQHSNVLVESMIRDALIRLNPEIKAQPDRADEVLYRLRTIPLSVQSEGLVRANELFAEWLRGEKSMPFGERGEHTPVRLIDFENLSNNDYVITNQWVYPVKEGGRRFDIIMLVNGIPLVVGEAKTPVRPAVTWVDGASDIHNGYEQSVPQMFVPNVFSFATEGKCYRYGSVHMPIDIWGPWHEGDNKSEGTLVDVQRSIRSMLRPDIVLDILQNFTLFATDKKHRRIKIICRYQQYEGANLMVARVVKGYPKKGLIWHFQGSGKSLLMVFAAQKLRMHRKLGNPTVMIVVDRIDLDTQITATFNAADIPNMIGAATRQELQSLLAVDTRKIIITTIHKFGEADGRLNERSNIIVMVDEAHRTQEGYLGRKMRDALPNAFLFGLTGTPINKRDRNTFWAFGANEDEQGYMSRYSFQDSIRDKATLPLHFEAVDVKLHIDKDAIDEAYSQMTDELSELDRDDLAKRAAKMAILIKAPARVNAICRHIVKHFQEKVDPNGFKAQVVTFDRECCVLYKKAMDELVGPEASAIVMHTQGGKSDEYAEWKLAKDEEGKLLDRFRDPNDPLKFLIVTSKLLTGFDAPILQVMYLDKPMKDHNLLQAICRTNRVYPGKTHGLIVDYLGIFDDVATALDFDEKSVQKVITNLDDLKEELPGMVARCLAFFPGVDRTVSGYEGLIAAQDCLPDNEARDKFAAEYSVLSRLWEALSPDPCLGLYEKDYNWLTQVYESVKPPSGNGKLLWHALGAKTIELVHENVHLETVRDDLDTLVMDAEVLEGLLDAKDPDKKSKEIEIKLIARLRKHKDNPRFVALGERLEKLKERHEQGLLHSLDFLKELLTLAREVVQAEKQVDPVDEQAKAKAALTELFAEVKSGKTPMVVERIVTDIDEIVRLVRFPGWQNTKAGEREVQKALRKVIYVKYQVKDQDLFDKAFGYIRQYY
ncbi:MULTISPECIES: type I restriction endonuclease subunit R [Dethiosulfovibrio]|uniref:Type I restriction enzyme endonuclease subunit n=2 Tax=Dethiosulfovibrio TaxID=47054 RepID=A0ABS9EMK1_9BACT|nr:MULTISPECIES: HsdR family type I site-specific deoxyribonuclease [Dethiosulfovibrio]MCF4113316.1 HsdR family type I site-specific deoxyribonuclease [Dethiosulfovibrio russensis]MCF4142380.1 HsdR family type I site-specific deoxyribonuclease [Dethiosulfovibrio marinus]MCF4145608.1 HsdR family type I site-specific deoxyribonuclease [Dethiosulfovibrio acidaminovorans]